MKAGSMIKLVKKFTKASGVMITYYEQEMGTNSRGQPIPIGEPIQRTAKVLLIKEKYNPLQVINLAGIGLSQDYTRYIIALPGIPLKKDMIVTDNHNLKWKLGIVDWFDIGGKEVCTQVPITEVS
jgi:hypothetical protein